MSDIREQDIDDTDGVSDMDGAGAADAAEHPADAGSSDATDASNTDGGVLSLVRDVVGKSEEQPAEASSATSEEDGQQSDAQTDAEPAADYSDVPFNKHPRFQEVLGKLRASETDATRYRNVQNFLDEQGLSAEETANGLTIMGLAKRNPAQAWEQIKPWVRDLLIASGEHLSDDLRQRVQNGEMSQAAALEVSRSRAQTNAAQHSQTFDQQQAARRQQIEQVQAVQSAATNWAIERQKRDPNFDAKLPALQREVAWLQSQEGRPTTVEGVNQQLKKAYDAVNAALPPAASVPQVQRKPVAPIRGGQVAGDARPEPKSVLDIVRAQRRAG